MKVVSIAECSLGAFRNTFDLHKAIIGLESQFLVFFLSDSLRQVLLYGKYSKISNTFLCSNIKCLMSGLDFTKFMTE